MLFILTLFVHRGSEIEEVKSSNGWRLRYHYEAISPFRAKISEDD